jgi:hypothetical protein
LLLTLCKGYELEKEKPNTSEDYFTRSEIVFIENGEEKTLHILYLRYFDEHKSEYTPYLEDPIFRVGEQEITFKDIVALVCLLKNPGFRHRKRVYINSQAEFSSYFQDIDFSKIPDIFQELAQGKQYDLRSPLEFIVQPH